MRTFSTPSTGTSPARGCTERREATPQPHVAPARLFRWRDVFAFVGPLDKVSVHRHASTALLVAPSAPFRVRASGARWQAAHGAILPAGVAHELDCGGHPLAVVYFDPLAFGPIAETSCIQLGGDDADWVQSGRACVHTLLEQSDAAPREIHRALLAEVLPRAGLPAPQGPGARLSELRHVLEAAGDWTLRLPDAAKRAGLSSFRFSHLFSQRVGLAWTAYRNWMRLIAVSSALCESPASLTTLAFDAGYSSSAHFAAAFRAAFGITPSQLRQRQPRLERYDATATPGAANFR